MEMGMPNEKHLKPNFGKREPSELAPLDVDRVRIKLSKKLAPQTVKHVLNLLTWIVNFGVKKQLCDGLKFHVQKPSVNNLRTEDLSDEELKRLLDAIEESPNEQIKTLMKLVLVTGLRRGEWLRLKWHDIDFGRGVINIRDPKGGVDQKIPLNNAARELLVTHPMQENCEYGSIFRNALTRITRSCYITPTIPCLKTSWCGGHLPTLLIGIILLKRC
jgi:integrase